MSVDASSQKFFEKAQRLMPGGVNSPVRAFKSVGGTPLYFKKAKGAWIWDVEGRRYIDYVGSWGPMILGHLHPRVVKAIKHALSLGTSFGAPHPGEITLAEKIKSLCPSIEKLRLVNSGTEAAMTAVRLARAFTGRDKIIKFEGCYHGHSDALLVKAGSGALTLGVPDSQGVPVDFAKHTLVLPFNDARAFEQCLEKKGTEIAAVIVEPVVGNTGCILPEAGFLETLRRETSKKEIVLIFDEVMTGFRVSLKSAQGLFKIKPDLTLFGKIIGGGLPVGAVGGLAKIMDLLAPVGPVYQAGTLSGNPLATAAGLATLEVLSESGVFETIEKQSSVLAEELKAIAKKLGVPLCVPQIGAMLSVFFSETPVRDLTTALRANTGRFVSFFQRMLAERVYLPPSPFEAWFVSLMHRDSEIEKTLKAAKKALEFV